MSFGFRVTHTDGCARRGVLTTAHGDVETPAFMPVGTQGAVKGVTNRDLEALGAEILLSNTYHLYLRPGDDLIARRGGLHRFIGWTRPILTDSGGYQVFSLAARRTVDEEGARFRSHLDGSAHLLTPEKAADIQAQLGSDVAMALDECLAHPASLDEAKASAAAASTSTQTPAATSTPAQIPAQPVRAVTVEEGEMYLRPSATALKAGVIAFVVTNNGSIHHEFVIVTGDPTGTKGDEPGRVSEANHIGGPDGPEIGDIAPGQAKVLTVTLAAGTYTAMCNLPGHYAAGMHFQFTVA